MTANIVDAPATTVAAAGASWRQRWFGGLTWKGLALIVALCVLNSMRRAGDIGPLAEWLPRFAEMFALVLIALLPPTFAIVATYNRAPAKARWRYPALAVAIVIASAASTTLMGIAESRGDMEYFLKQNSSALWQAHPLFWWGMSVWPRYAVLSVVIAVVFVFFRVREESEIETQRAELERVRFAQQMEEARLQMLQAQIEPHFLFNTLANVRRLYQSEPAAGETMLDNLMRYLAVALPQMRAADTTIGRESILIESYLNIQRIRMGARLSFEIDVPDPLREVRIPPLMLLTLVENSIKHGLNPLPEGGSIRVTAEVADGVLRIRVIDTGGGFTKSSGGGTGLANTRARLAAVYGPAAKLALTLNQPHGVTATITVPWSGVAAAAR
jgi:signal transduction histidine kinase